MKVVSLYDSWAKINFPWGYEVPEFGAIDPRVVSRREVQENREAFERLEVARADEEYMVELRRNYPELVAEERWWLEMYTKGATDEAGPCRGEIIDLSFSDSCSGFDDDPTMVWIGRRS